MKVYHSTTDTLFYNSQCLFVEYHDVLSMPWLTLLTLTRTNQSFDHIFQMEGIDYLTADGMVEWYVYRKYRNIFKSIGLRPNVENVQDDFYEKFLYKCMNEIPTVYRINTDLRFMAVLRILLQDKGMVKKFIVYSEEEEKGIQDVLEYYFKDLGTRLEYRYGNLESIIDSVPIDSTYVFSDIEKVRALESTNHLDYSTVIIPNGLRYNYLENDPKTIKVDLKKLNEKHIFKYSFFDNFDVSGTINGGNIPLDLSKLKEVDTQINIHKNSNS